MPDYIDDNNEAATAMSAGALPSPGDLRVMLGESMTLTWDPPATAPAAAWPGRSA